MYEDFTDRFWLNTISLILFSPQRTTNHNSFGCVAPAHSSSSSLLGRSSSVTSRIRRLFCFEAKGAGESISSLRTTQYSNSKNSLLFECSSLLMQTRRIPSPPESSAMFFHRVQRRTVQADFCRLVSNPVRTFSSPTRQIPGACGRRILGATSLSCDLRSIPGLDILSMRGRLDNVTDRLLEANIIRQISGGFQFCLANTEAIIAYRKGLALGSTPFEDSPLPNAKFPERAEDFAPGTHFDLRPWWSWTMDRDFENSHKVHVCFSPFPSELHVHRRTHNVLAKKLSSFHPRGSTSTSALWVYWFFEPPWTLKIGRTVNLARRMLEWHRKCPNPLRIWCGAYVTSYGSSVETLAHWKVEQATYDRPNERCWSCDQ
ncbi:hypothetical protein GYMLUDRAFT_64944 [Collybiopsis luxurians FD-317 M1]|uniref:Unplaced genomic scaffold GYMLUscaffold_122, whole genome shotgun sequence n=1 Tax=Collybiopsis luxurians FD-317 M1 TaxID=944289 RepID=A0A0D0BNR0_9AGAR|nr:hypothetical protein GYMLUDRAFT_64944 [Collybiopsis luxurians FD-317 M1]